MNNCPPRSNEWRQQQQQHKKKPQQPPKSAIAKLLYPASELIITVEVPFQRVHQSPLISLQSSSLSIIGGSSSISVMLVLLNWTEDGGTESKRNRFPVTSNWKHKTAKTPQSVSQWWGRSWPMTMRDGAHSFDLQWSSIYLYEWEVRRMMNWVILLYYPRSNLWASGLGNERDLSKGTGQQAVVGR